MDSSQHPRIADLRAVPAAGQTIPALLERQAALMGDAPLLQAGDVVRSFAEVRDGAAQAAAVLAEAGVARGDRVALLLPNRLEFVDAFLGATWLGALAVPLNTALKADGLQHALTNSGARLLITDAQHVTRLNSIESAPELAMVWVLDEVPGEPLGFDVRPAPRLVGGASSAPAAALRPGDLSGILYTSGTTGPAKGVCCPHGQFCWWGLLMSELFELSSADVLYSELPLFHTAALGAFFQAVVSGARFVLGERFSASRYWERAGAHGATVGYLLGTMVSMLDARPPSALDRAHTLRRALAPATPAATAGPFEARFGVRLVEVYGSTETNAVIGAPLDSQRAGWMGRPLPEFDVAVVDEDDFPVPVGEPGELVVRSRHPHILASGYFKQPEQTVKAWRNLWFHTGDQVIEDEDGWIRFVDRAKDAIRRRGENISTWEVEQALRRHPDVEHVAAFGVPSELGEDEVMAAVVLVPEASLDPVALTQHCAAHLPYFAVPRFLEAVDELPCTATGKVRKEVLRAAGVGPGTWDRDAAGVVVPR